MEPHRVNRKRQNEVFLEWAQTYDAILWKIARSYARFGEHLELHQDLLVTLWNAVPLYRTEAKVSTFIYRVALNGAMNWTRNRQRYTNRHVDLDEIPNPPHAWRDSLAEAAGEKESRVARLYSALEALSEADRSLALLYLDDFSYRDIAEVLGISESNVGVKLNRVKKRLAEYLGVGQEEVTDATR